MNDAINAIKTSLAAVMTVSPLFASSAARILIPSTALAQNSPDRWVL
jgi:hypothetical protein